MAVMNSRCGQLVSKERPILFSGAMVRAILEGRKTVTRRLLKDHQIPKLDPHSPPVDGMRWSAIAQRHSRYGFCAFGATEAECAAELALLNVCPYGKPGDRLWVREAHSIHRTHGQRRDDGERWGPWGGLPTRISPDGTQIAYYREGFDRCDPGRWRPSIHMPRWASRILLEITAARVERLQDISEEQALAEGVKSEPCDHARQACADIGCWGDTAKGAFGFLWEQLNGAGSWAANPWVWVVEFKRQEASDV
jgi:hypothetical protein